MKTIFHDKESGTRLEMEGTLRNSKAQLVDDEGNVLIESEGSYSEILEMISQLPENNEQEKEEPQELCEDIDEDEENITNEQKNIQPDELFVVNNDEMKYCLGFKKGEIVKFLLHRGEGLPLPLMFRNSKGIDQALEYEDVTLLENQKGNKLRFNFCYENDILLTEDTSLKGTKVNLTEHSAWIDDDDNLFIEEDESDGVPYVASLKSGKGAYISLEHLETSKEEDSVEDIEFEVGDIVKVKQGKENGGAVGYAKITHIRCSTGVAELEGTDNDGIFSDGYVNAIRNLEKIK